MSGVFGCAKTDSISMEISMELLPSLHPAGIAPKCEELFDKNGYAPLEKFYAMEGGEQAFAEYAEIVGKELSQIASKVSQSPGNTLSMFGHAVFLNAAAMMVVGKVWNGDEKTINQLKSLDLGEAEGIQIDFNGNTCTVKHISVRPHELW
mmetsp:Transcript_33412/g.51949  ORF Transcript_33412/g.51949 Transcript_33412/m.51949 type:complete len:150 (+) Transcript_33412:34-483(+)